MNHFFQIIGENVDIDIFIYLIKLRNVKIKYLLHDKNLQIK